MLIKRLEIALLTLSVTVVAMTLPASAKEHVELAHFNKQVVEPKQPVKAESIPQPRQEANLVVEKPKAAPVPVASSGGDIENIVRQAARKYGVDENYFVHIARCESGLNPRSVNKNYYAGGGNPSGLFQFLPETWNRIGSRSPEGVGDVFNPVHNANVAAWAFAHGYAGEWECK